MTRPEQDRTMSDDELLEVLGHALADEDPLPAAAVEFATEALVWRDMEGELAALLHDSASEEAVVLRDATSVRLLVFQAGAVTLDVEHGPDGLTGAVSPPGRYRVEVHEVGSQVPRPPGRSVLADESGMFELKVPVHGSVRFVVREPDGRVAVLSPWVTM